MHGDRMVIAAIVARSETKEIRISEVEMMSAEPGWLEIVHDVTNHEFIIKLLPHQ